jgi:GNAT superfamily N-acetyltransferase
VIQPRVAIIVMLRGVVIPELVSDAALFPEDDLPAPPPEHPFRQVRGHGYVVGLFPGHTLGNVAVRALDADAVERTVLEVRRLLAEDGKSRGAWMVAEAASPGGLAERLKESGMVPFDDPPLEPLFAAMAIVAPPEGDGGVEARPPRTFEEFQASARVGFDVFDVPAQDRAAHDAEERRLWELQLQGIALRSFVALVDDEVVGGAAVILGANAGFLAGGYTRADMRGRGVYRALVRARWDAVVEAGTPALTVSAGRMSRPILERLGFQTVGWIDCLLDDFG